MTLKVYDGIRGLGGFDSFPLLPFLRDDDLNSDFVFKQYEYKIIMNEYELKWCSD